MQWLLWHWHRFWEWAHQLRATRLYERWQHHRGRSIKHGQEADRIDPRASSDRHRPF